MNEIYFIKLLYFGLKLKILIFSCVSFIFCYFILHFYILFWNFFSMADQNFEGRIIFWDGSQTVGSSQLCSSSLPFNPTQSWIFLNLFLRSEHILCKESIVIVKKFDFEILTYLYVLRSPEFIYAIFGVMYVCVCVCICVCVCVCEWTR